MTEPGPGVPSYLVGVDIGGTFTDCVVTDGEGGVVTAKSPTTPDDFAQGMLNALDDAAAGLGIELGELCRRTVQLTHGTTIGTNAIVQRRGARVGLITTKGHTDIIHIMRGSRGIVSRDIRKVVHFPESAKPDPIVPKRLVEGVSERVDCFGEVVVPLNEAEAEQAIHRLLAQDVAAIAICFLWSFRYPGHERRVKELVHKIAPDVFVSCSADLMPKWGEYERTTAVAINSYIGPLTSGYLRNLDRELKARGYQHPLQITQCGGGTISVEKAVSAPLLTLDSGPAAGVTGSQYLGEVMGCRNIITTDMGGTSFDVGVIFDGKPAYSFVSNTHQYEYFLPKIDIQAIGAGGGSLVRVDALTKTLRVGPESAGAVPGPVCYGRGGTIATVTDADVVLGYLDPDNFAGGKIKLDKAAAERAVQVVADQLGLPLMACASGIAKIVEFQMADIIRKMTIQKGFDPRDFVLFAFGGAGPAHACVFAGELGISRVIVPQNKTASTWCAFGAAAAPILHVYEQAEIQASPFVRDRINANLAALEDRASTQMAEDGFAPGQVKFQASVDIRHKGQIHEVEVFLPQALLPPNFQDDLANRFFARYEQLYGKASSFRGSQLELVTFRLRASAETPRPRLLPSRDITDHIAAAARRGARAIWWDRLQRTENTPIFDGALLKPGNRVAGPTVVETRDTTVVVHPGHTLTVDALGNFEIDVGRP
jgi:N-methylhydantoinase A